MNEDPSINAENPPETKDEANQEELSLEQLDEVAGGEGAPGHGGRE
jgi:hypothetical protein